MTTRKPERFVEQVGTKWFVIDQATGDTISRHATRGAALLAASPAPALSPGERVELHQRLCAQTTTRTDPETGSTRLAVVIDPDQKLTSLDVVLADGTHVCRLNLFTGQDGKWADVDVIKARHEQVFKALAWANGRADLSHTISGTLVGVDIREP